MAVGIVCHSRPAILVTAATESERITVAWPGIIWTKLLAVFRLRRVDYGLALRVTAAAVLSLAIAEWLQLNLPLWAVLTSIMVSQVSLGGSLKATLDYFIGTLGGVVYAGLIAVFVPHPNALSLLGVLALAIAPLALLAAVRPSLRPAPLTAAILILVPEMTHTSPLTSIVDRILEVGLGGIVGVLVSSLLMPSSAFRLTREAAAQTLDRMADALDALFAGLAKGLDADAVHGIQDGLGRSLTQLSAVAAEAEQERSAQLATAPGTGPLLRTLLRLRHDLVMLGRAGSLPLPANLADPLRIPLEEVRSAAITYLLASADALRAEGTPTSIEAVTGALAGYSSVIGRLRQDGQTRGLPGDVTERFFALGFALEQLGQNCRDLERCVAEWTIATTGPSKSLGLYRRSR